MSLVRIIIYTRNWELVKRILDHDYQTDVDTEVEVAPIFHENFSLVLSDVEKKSQEKKIIFCVCEDFDVNYFPEIEKLSQKVLIMNYKFRTPNVLFYESILDLLNDAPIQAFQLTEELSSKIVKLNIGSPN